MPLKCSFRNFSSRVGSHSAIFSTNENWLRKSYSLFRVFSLWRCRRVHIANLIFVFLRAGVPPARPSVWLPPPPEWVVAPLRLITLARYKKGNGNKFRSLFHSLSLSLNIFYKTFLLLFFHAYIIITSALLSRIHSHGRPYFSCLFFPAVCLWWNFTNP